MTQPTVASDFQERKNGASSWAFGVNPWFWLLILLFAFLYLEPAKMISRAWFKDNGYYTHGPLIPFVTAFLIYRERDRLSRIPIRPNWLGLLLLLLCSLGFLISTLCHMYPPKYFLFVFYLLGFNLLLFGVEMVKATLLPWFFLFFMVPLPDAVIDLFTYRLRIFVTAASVKLVDPFDWAIVKSGNFIFFADGDQLVVDDVCAGLRSLISLLALGAIFAYMSRLNLAGKISLFLLSAPVAVATNVLRIFALIVIAQFWGSRAVSGVVHDFSGYAIFVVAFLLLLALQFLLERLPPFQDRTIRDEVSP